MGGAVEATTRDRRLGYALFILFAINFMNFYDRQVVGAIGERIKQDWQLSDSQLSLLSTAFVLLYALVGIPLGRWADTRSRRMILSVSVLVWSLFTALSGIAWGFGALFAFRLMVGVGEAGCAPAANSLIGDLFPPEKRARAIGIFMLGLPFGLGASFLLSGLVVEWTGGWRSALFVAAAPGFLLGLLALRLPEPVRGGADPHITARSDEAREAIRRVLRVPSMRWIIASGALLNLIMYAMAGFVTSFLIRYHGLGLGSATRISGIVYTVGGVSGTLLGAWLADRAARTRVQGRLQLAAAVLAISAPLAWLALAQGRGESAAFALFLVPVCVCLYCYYPSVYATIQDVIEPGSRGTAMAVYFFVFYLFTAAGLFGFGRLSDGLAARAVAAGQSARDASASGLHGALYSVPILATLLALVLWAGSRHVARDHARLRAV
jgi:MFS family permease